VLDWSQLCILPARQSYIRHYGKMASGPEKAFSVLAFHETKSVVTLQRQFQRKYGKSPLSQPSIRAWYRVLLPMAVCVKAKSPAGRLWVQSVLKPFDNRLCVVRTNLCGVPGRTLTADNTTRAQDTDQRGLCKQWSGNPPQRVVGGWISVWRCSSHSWRSHWTLLMTNYCS
jgi:hypothetical protein